MLGDLLDRIAAIEQHTFVAVNIGDLRFATRRRGETRIGSVSEFGALDGLASSLQLLYA